MCCLYCTCGWGYCYVTTWRQQTLFCMYNTRPQKTKYSLHAFHSATLSLTIPKMLYIGIFHTIMFIKKYCKIIVMYICTYVDSGWDKSIYIAIHVEKIAFGVQTYSCLLSFVLLTVVVPPLTHKLSPQGKGACHRRDHTRKESP